MIRFTFLALLFCNFSLLKESSFAAVQKRVVAQTACEGQLCHSFEKLASKYRLNPGHFGIWVSDLNDPGAVLFHSQHKKQFMPASLSKIVTALAVLDLMDLDLTFKTQLYTCGSIQKGVADSLVLVGAGDPGFLPESLLDLVTEARSKGLRTLSNHIWYDDSLFDRDYFDSSRGSKRVDRAYDAPISALSFSWNSVSFIPFAGANVGEKVSVGIEPWPSDYIRLINRTKTSNRKSRMEVFKTAPHQNGDQFIVTGQWGAEQASQPIYRSIAQPGLWAAQNLKAALINEGIAVTTQSQVRSTIDKAFEKSGCSGGNKILLAEVHGPSVEELVHGMLKYSNNFIAEMMVKQLSVLAGDRPGTLELGIKQINKWLTTTLKKTKAAGTDFIFTNPSGLTKENKLTAEQFGELMRWALSPALSARKGIVFLNGLPLAKVDGTLKNRGRLFHPLTTLRAKTGLLKDSGAIALAGLFQTDGGAWKVFSILYNAPHSVVDVQNVWNFMDAFVGLWGPKT